MIKLAQLYKAGMFVYVYWLRAFFETPIAQRKVIELEDKYAHSDSESDSDIFQGIGRNEWKVAPYVPEEDLLRDDTVNANWDD